MDSKTLSTVISVLGKKYHVKLEKEDPFEILIHGILSTRTKDTTTFPAQARLLKVAGTPDKIVKLDTHRIEKLIYPVGFYKTKAKHLKSACRVLLDRFGGKVPDNKEDLLMIPGVGHKVASLVLVWGFGLPYVPVDTHVNRISKRLGVVQDNRKPERTQIVLESMLSDRLRIIANHTLVQFGRDICKPMSPQCYRCPVYEYCEYKNKAFYRNRQSK